MDNILAGLICGLVLAVVVWIVQSLDVAPHWIIVGFVAGLIVTFRCNCKRTKEASS
jgi:glucose uptake protein GlcU